MFCSPSKAKKGAEWTSEVYFDPRADGSDSISRISDGELNSKFKAGLLMFIKTYLGGLCEHYVITLAETFSLDWSNINIIRETVKTGNPD